VTSEKNAEEKAEEVDEAWEMSMLLADEKLQADSLLEPHYVRELREVH
jgi:hypothetical protein